MAETQHNPYAGEQMPMGFGAERANLMGEAPVSMPTEVISTAGSSDLDHGNSNSGASDADLSARAKLAKTNLIREILSFNKDREQAEDAVEDHKDESEQASSVFTVRDPVKVHKVMKYTVTGRDSKGQWSCQRRFNEFEALQKQLCERWPGCYIPAIPEKVMVTIDMSSMKMADNTDAEFVESRRALLELFIRQISHFEYLIESREFQIFARGAGEVTEQLSGLEP